jgi:hypothetical protein
MRRSSRLVPSLVTTVVLFGCASTFQAYPGPRLPSEQVAVIELEHISFLAGGGRYSALTVSMVDGIRIYYDGSGYRASNGAWSSNDWAGPPMSVELLAGDHTITFVPYPRMTQETGITERVHVTGGKRYRAIGTVEPKRLLQSATTTGWLGTWKVEIIEEHGP